MLEVDGAYKQSWYGQIWMKSLHVKSKVKVFATQDGQMANQPAKYDQLNWSIRYSFRFKKKKKKATITELIAILLVGSPFPHYSVTRFVSWIRTSIHDIDWTEVNYNHTFQRLHIVQCHPLAPICSVKNCRQSLFNLLPFSLPTLSDSSSSQYLATTQWHTNHWTL